MLGTTFFRRGISAYFIYYYIILLINFSSAFTRDYGWLIILTIVGAMLFFALFFGLLKRHFLLVVYVINLIIHTYTYPIHHIPQALANLALLFLFFIHVERNDPILQSNKVEKINVQIMIAFLGIYYFLSGFKKIFIPEWFSGEFIQLLLQNGLYAKNNFIVGIFFEITPIISMLVLIFELLYLPLVFTRFRYVVFYGAIFLHLFIEFTLFVGSFSYLMIALNLLLVDQNIYRQLQSLRKKFSRASSFLEGSQKI